MKFFVTILVAATAVLAQQQEGNQGPNLSNGPSAVDNANINSGWQAQGSFFDGSKSGENLITGHVDGSFNHQASNSAIQDSNFVNPSESTLTGNTGDSANGHANNIGDFIAGGGFIRRDAVLNNFGAHPAVDVGFVHPVAVPQPVPAFHPVPVAVPRPIPVPVPHPVAVPRPIPVPVPRPVPVPIPHPVAVPRPIPVPQPVPVPHPIPVPEPVPHPVPVPVAAPVPVPVPVPHPVVAAPPPPPPHAPVAAPPYDPAPPAAGPPPPAPPPPAAAAAAGSPAPGPVV
ncbi:hypothetical protein GGI11_008351 [Coemansia sp. RSA 2049]|nr:hypothetical protein GGI11_008351 [Coemansia sp. RSA 2049]